MHSFRLACFTTKYGESLNLKPSHPIYRMGSRRREGGGKKLVGSFGQIRVDENLKIAVNISLKKFLTNPEEAELSLPSSLYSTERAYVHQVAAEMGLQSKSRGKGQTR